MVSSATASNDEIDKMWDSMGMDHSPDINHQQTSLENWSEEKFKDAVRIFSTGNA